MNVGMKFTTTLRDVGSAIIFLGLLGNNHALVDGSSQILEELSARGYSIPTAEIPVRVVPAQTSGDFSSRHAGGWRPGMIYIRETENSVMLKAMRHELMHEVMLRTCGNKIPNWAMEAAAISFSGEAIDDTAPSAEAISHLQSKVSTDAPLDRKSYQTLVELVNQMEPHLENMGACSINEALSSILVTGKAYNKSPFSYLIMHVQSARILLESGDIDTPLPPGSLMKIPYVASLEGVDADSLGKALAESDENFLCQNEAKVNFKTLNLLLSLMGENLGESRSLTSEALPDTNSQTCRQLLGERNSDRSYPVLASLKNIALTIRASLLISPKNFLAANQNGFLPKSTLFASGSENLQLLSSLRAIAKTGTASTSLNDPLVAHIAIAWPVEAPMYISVFHQGSKLGKELLEPAAAVLRNFSQNHPIPYSKVRVTLLEKLQKSDWGVEQLCPEFVSPSVNSANGNRLVSTCGAFKIVSNAPRSKQVRIVYGVLDQSNAKQTVLETDPETYADSVVTSEDDELSGEPLKAFRAVIVWNATRAGHRHSLTNSLCDTTHCMVFGGAMPDTLQPHGEVTDYGLLNVLDNLAHNNHLEWLQFSRGGQEPWQKEILDEDLLKILKEDLLLDIQLQPSNTPGVSLVTPEKNKVKFVYREGEETVSCEFFRNKMKLLSCPETAIHSNSPKSHWIFTGRGSGHGIGLDLTEAKLAQRTANLDAVSILNQAYFNP